MPSEIEVQQWTRGVWMVQVGNRMQRAGKAGLSVPGIFAVICVLAGSLAQGGMAQASPPSTAPTTTQLSIATREGDSRTTALFTAHVRGVGSSAIPAGSVSLKLGEQWLGSALLDENGVATYTVDALPEGSQQIVAAYEGSASFAASTSPASPLESFASAVPDFTVVATGPTALSVKAGQFATTTFQVNPENGFNQIVSFSCSGLPIAATCTFTPEQAQPDPKNLTTPILATLNIQTVAVTGGRAEGKPSGNRPLYAMVLPGLLALAGLGAARKRLPGLRMFGLAALLLASGVGLGACSAQYSYFRHPPTVNKGTPAGVSPVTVSASSNSGNVAIIHTQVITLTVTN